MTARPVFDIASIGEAEDVTTKSWFHIASGEDRCVLVGVGHFDGGTGYDVVGVTYGGRSMTQIAQTKVGGETFQMTTFYMLDPPTGSKEVEVTFEGEINLVVAIAVSYVGVLRIGDFAVANDSSGIATVDLIGGLNSLVVDFASSPTAGTLTVGVDQIERAKDTIGNKITTASSEEAGGLSPTTMSWTVTASTNWIIHAVALLPTPDDPTGPGRSSAGIANTGGCGVRAFIHQPVPPFGLIAGPVSIHNPNIELTMSDSNTVGFKVAMADVSLNWLEPGMCWVIEYGCKPNFCAGFVEERSLELEGGRVEIDLLDPLEALLSVEAVNESISGAAGNAVAHELIATQGRYDVGVLEGIIEPSIRLNMNVRGETVAAIISALADVSKSNYLVRVERTVSGLKFFLDFGLLRDATDIVIGRGDLVHGIFIKGAPVSSVTMLGEGSSFASRSVATTAVGVGRSQGPQGTRFDGGGAVNRLVERRNIGPGSVRHVVEINERVSEVADLSSVFLLDRLRQVDEIMMTVDLKRPSMEEISLGDVVKLQIETWTLPDKDGVTLGVDTSLHIHTIEPHPEDDTADVIGWVVQDGA